MSATAARHSDQELLPHINRTLARLCSLPMPALLATPANRSADPVNASQAALSDICRALLGSPTCQTDALGRAAHTCATGRHGAYLQVLGQGCAALASGDARTALDAAIALNGVPIHNPLLPVLAAHAHTLLGQPAEALVNFQNGQRLIAANEMLVLRAGHTLELMSATPVEAAAVANLAQAAIDHLRDPRLNSSRIGTLVVNLLRARYQLQPGLGPAPVLDTIRRDKLLLAALPQILLPAPDVEHWLLAIRGQLLQAVLDNAAASANDDLLAAMAAQTWLNEHVYAVTESDHNHVARLGTAVSNGLRSRAADQATLARRLLAITLYEPLTEQPFFAALCAEPARTWPASLHGALDQAITQPQREAAARDAVITLTPVSDAVSTRVQAQYEDNPYPRWRQIGSVPAGTSYLRFYGLHRPPYRKSGIGRQRQRILVAGCGTGRQPLSLALAFPDAAITAIDLSRASLAYAQLKADELGVRNVRFVQADILQLGHLRESFHVIECMGVLHHMRAPQAGLAALRRLLARRGIIKLGLYSRHARRTLAPNLFATWGTDRASVRNFRTHIMSADSADSGTSDPAAASGDAQAFALWLRAEDFYSTSMCRDLVLHTQEQRLTLVEIAALLADQQLTFRAFEFPGTAVRDQVVTAFRRQFGGAQALTDLHAWDQFEQRHPDTFVGMYQLYAQAS